MKKAIPALIAIVLIILIAGFALGGKVVEKYSYSTEREDLNAYFEITDASQVPIIRNGEVLSVKAVLKEGTYYLDLDSVKELLNSRFYWDQNENWLIYTTPTERIMAQVGSSTYSIEGASQDLGYVISYEETVGEDRTLYVALDFVYEYTDFQWQVFPEPNRIVLSTQDYENQVVYVKKDTAIRRRGGVKSPIMREVKEGDRLVVIEPMEEWTTVVSEDGLIGCIENKRISEATKEITKMESNGYVTPEYTSMTSDSKISLGWHVVAGIGGNDTIYSAIEPTKGMDVISPTWFALSDNFGNYQSFATENYVNIAHNQGLQVWAVIDDFTNSVDDDVILSYTSTRDYLINNLVSEALSKGIDGINVDFEDLPAAAGEDFAQFLRELSIQCRINHLVLSVDDYVPFAFNDYYDLRTQGEVADYVIIMGYDEHYHGSNDVGSVASIDYVKHGITETMKEVPAGKIINGIPFYSILWRTEGATVTDDYVTMINQADLVSKLGVTTEWDDETCQNYFETTSGGIFYQMWLEDADSIQVKLNVMKTNEIGGVAVWRLGYEDPSIWSLISAYSE